VAVQEGRRRGAQAQRSHARLRPLDGPTESARQRERDDWLEEADLQEREIEIDRKRLVLDQERFDLAIWKIRRIAMTAFVVAVLGAAGWTFVDKGELPTERTIKHLAEDTQETVTIPVGPNGR
jgi:hypothetical protein